MHLPMRARTSESHRGDSLSVAGVEVLEKRYCGDRGIGRQERGVGSGEGRTRVARVVKGRMIAQRGNLI